MRGGGLITVYRRVEDRQGYKHLICYRVAYGVVVSVAVYDNTRGTIVHRVIGQIPALTIGVYHHG